MDRRHFIRNSLSVATYGVMPAIRKTGVSFPQVRIPPGQRKFISPAVERTIERMRSSVANGELTWLFENCFPNTLDSTVDYGSRDGKPDCYVITGDIDAMWLRDSSAQVWPYLTLIQEDGELQRLIRGVIHRQAYFILLDPYANAFYKDPARISEWRESDRTEMKPGVHERKWEIDSLCYPIRLSYGYWSSGADPAAFDEEWKLAMREILRTFRQQQRLDGPGPYSFQRKTSWATDGVPMGGYGYPTRKIGLIHSMFRPSDDATVYPYLIPSNLFAAVSLRQLQRMLEGLGSQAALERSLLSECRSLQTDLEKALREHAVFVHERHGSIYGYETDGFGNYLFMDDANVPSLLSLPYLGAVSPDDPVYQRTRRRLLSPDNPFFFTGRAGEGIGGPHVGLDRIWPLSVIMRALTSRDDHEIKSCLDTLQHSHAGSGFMHESFHKDDPARFTRSWFAWANTLFGELLLILQRQRPYLLC